MLFKDIDEKNIDELNVLISDLKAELFTLRFKNKTGQNDQPHKINLVRKDIAKVFTAIKAKELAQKKVKKGTK